jgi:hypothetical protein
LAAIVRDGVVFQGGGSVNEELLLAMTRRFIASLQHEKIPHVLVGGMALLQHVEGRNTRDIDLIMALEDLPRLPGFVLRERNEWFGWGECGPLRVALLFSANPLFAHVAEQHAEEWDFLGTTLRCATPEGIILLKLFALPSLYRQRQVDRATLYETDVLLLLRRYPVADETLLDQLRPHVSEADARALHQVLNDLRARLARPSDFT